MVFRVQRVAGTRECFGVHLNRECVGASARVGRADSKYTIFVPHCAILQDCALGFDVRLGVLFVPYRGVARKCEE